MPQCRQLKENFTTEITETTERDFIFSLCDLCVLCGKIFFKLMTLRMPSPWALIGRPMRTQCIVIAAIPVSHFGPFHYA
jgi:hypothetical protein